ncbi:MAG TPA: dihydrodipicolinate synthase family protein [Bryobacteraceae bacterium]|nr:dihydrodipicolinate synthase family protein [Bryobacteraceae bacterium]
MSRFSGILPAVVTPLDVHGRLLESSFRALLEFLYRSPIDGVYVGGQSGEGLFLSVEERKRLTELAVECSPAEKTVIVHVGCTRVHDAIELARHAERSGVNALSSLPPAGPYGFDEVLRYYTALTSATDLPFFVYHFSDYTKGVTSVAQLLRLCALPNVVGLKFTDYDLFTLSELKANGALVYYGRDEMLSAGLLYGADGGIGTFYNLLPNTFADIYALASRGRWEETKPLQEEVQRLIRTCSGVPMLGAIKTILGWMGIPCGPCVPPRCTLDERQEALLRKNLEESGYQAFLQPVNVA